MSGGCRSAVTELRAAWTNLVRVVRSELTGVAPVVANARDTLDRARTLGYHVEMHRYLDVSAHRIAVIEGEAGAVVWEFAAAGDGASQQCIDALSEWLDDR